MTERSDKPFLSGSSEPFKWDWWGENPAEIVLVVFIIVLFFFFHSLPPQGWGIDVRPDAAEATPAAAAE